MRVDIARMWNKNTNVIPVVTGEKGSILNSLENHLKNIGTSSNITTLQKYVLVGEAQILRCVLSVSDDGLIENTIMTHAKSKARLTETR